MSDLTAEQLAQRAIDLDLIEPRAVEEAWSHLGSRQVSVEELSSVFLRREFLTNWQLDRLLEGKRVGYFYGGYKVLYLVGAGTFARVYRAVHRESGEIRAVKVLRQRYSDDLGKTEQFLREASVVIPLRHQNIVRIHEVKSDRGRHYMVMDFVEGQNLRDFVRVHKRLSVQHSIQIITDVASGLDYAFQRGITHRDMKLSNVLLATKGRAELVDFGLAAYDGKLTDEALANVSNARSIDYAALERATSVRKDDKRSDIYFAGCMLYHMLTGVPALTETRDRIQRLNVSRFHDIEPATSLVPSLPHRVVSALNKAMALNPDERFQTPGEFLADLKITMQSLTEADTVEQETAADKAAREAGAQPTVPQLEGESHTVMIVETNVKLQNVLRDHLKKLGYRVLVIGSPERALERFQFGERAADCVIFGASELGVEALEAFNTFATQSETRDISAVLLVDKRQIPWTKQAELGEHRVVVSMPLKFGAFRAKLRELVTASSLDSPS